MKAITFERYGSPDVLSYTEIDKPTPGTGEILIRVAASSLNAADWRVMRANPFLIRFFFGILRPKFNVLGADIAGTVEAVGAGVTKFQPGDRVFSDLSLKGFGGLAEYRVAHENDVVRMPEVSFEEGAALPLAAITALQAIRDIGKVRRGQHVMIHGASGGVGTYAVQIAKALGAEVTAVCSSGKREMVEFLGADHIVDYRKEDFLDRETKYDLIIGVNGRRPVKDYVRALVKGGIFVLIGGSSGALGEVLLKGAWIGRRHGVTVKTFTATCTSEDLEIIREMVEDGKINPVIDRIYTLPETPDAFRYLEEGHAKGKVVISLEELN